MRILIVALALTIGAMLTGPHAVLAQTGTNAFCLRNSTGATQCLYSTMAQCQAAIKDRTTDTCVMNPNAR
jgi:hypothetical protein